VHPLPAEHNPHDLPGLAGSGITPPVAERADHLQPATGLGEGTGCSRHWSRSARVGDRTQQPSPVLQQAEADRASPGGIAGPRQGVLQRVSHQLRHDDCDVLAAVCRVPPTQSGEREVSRSMDRPGLSAERARGNPRQAIPACPGGMRPRAPAAVRQTGHLRGEHQPPAAGARGQERRVGGRSRCTGRTGACTILDLLMPAVWLARRVPSGARGRLARRALPSGPRRWERRCWLARAWLRRPGRGIAVGGSPGCPGDGRVPVPQHDRASRPEARVGLLALRAG
jgi:hypothetical protein